MPDPTDNAAAPTTVRLDKWLWAARFFKTRSAASVAVDGGKVDVGGEGAKRPRALHVGGGGGVRRPPLEYQVMGRGLADPRGPAKVGATLYEETAGSPGAREPLGYQME